MTIGFTGCVKHAGAVAVRTVPYLTWITPEGAKVWGWDVPPEDRYVRAASARGPVSYSLVGEYSVDLGDGELFHYVTLDTQTGQITFHDDSYLGSLVVTVRAAVGDFAVERSFVLESTYFGN